MEPIWVLTLSDDPLALAFSPDGRQLATYAKNGRIQVWVWPDGVKSTIPKILFEAEIPALEAAKLRWSNDGSQLAAGVSLSDYWTPAPSPTQGVYLWRIPSGESVGSGLEIPQDVISLAFSGEGKYLAAGTQSGAARIFDTLTGRPRTPILPHSDGVSCVEFDFSGARLITGSFDQTVRVWSVPLGELLHGDLRFKGPIITVGLTQVGSSLLVASRDGTAGLWDSATFEPIIPWIRSSEPIRCAAFSPRGTMIVTGGANRRVRLTSLVFPRIELGQAEAVVAALAAFTVDQSGRCQSILPEEATAAWQRLGPIWP